MPESEETYYLKCPCCGEKWPIKWTAKRNSKPFVTWQCCGIQIFFRGQRSIELLAKRLDDGDTICLT